MSFCEGDDHRQGFIPFSEQGELSPHSLLLILSSVGTLQA